MHLSLHRKAFKKGLLICNGHETYYDDLSNIFDEIHLIDPYHQKEDYLESLEIFKEYLLANNINDSSLKVIYSSCIDSKADIKSFLDENFHICGNGLLKYTQLSNPYKLDKNLFEDDIVLPDISDKFHYKFLSKKNNSSGGLSVGNDLDSSNVYYQEFIPGKTYSVSFISNGINSQILGFNQLFSVKDNSQYPYLYAGAMTLGMGSNELSYYKKWIDNFSSLYDVRGFCSIDYKVFNNKIYILDINPRLSGTYKLYRKMYKNLMNYHLGLSSEKLEPVSNDYYAYIILYARNDLVIDESIKSLEDISDIPISGETFKKNMPILTLNIHACDKNKLVFEIKERIKSAMKIIDCYNIDLDHE